MPKLIAAVCPSCGANIEIPKNTDRCFCSYCGNQILTETAITFTKARIDGTVSTKKEDFVIVGGILTQYNGSDTVIEIPEGVVEVQTDSFDFSAITTIRFPRTVKIIAGFDSCHYLEEIEFPDSVQEISGFNDCDSLARAKFPPTLSCLRGFRCCSALEKVSIGGSPHLDGPFWKCANLREVHLQGNPRLDGSFRQCENLEVIEAPNLLLRVDPDKDYEIADENSFVGANLETINVGDEETRAILSMLASGQSFWCIQRNRKRQLEESHRMRQGLCRHCGGPFRGIFIRSCKWCGKDKDY